MRQTMNIRVRKTGVQDIVTRLQSQRFTLEGVLSCADSLEILRHLATISMAVPETTLIY